MTNLYWPVYKNLEKEIITLSNLIHFDDYQLSIYSIKISELIIRCSVEIESISKDLFLLVGGEVPKEGDLYFDTHCLRLLEEKWLLSKKQVIISAPNFYFKEEKNKIFTPLNKAFKRGTSGADWKIAYQAVKHERVKNLTSGNIKNLIRAMGALFILNLYFKDEVYNLEKDSKATNFPFNMGSDLFAIKLHKWSSYNGNGVYGRKPDFDECIYLTKWKQESEDKINEANQKMHQEQTHFLLKHPKFIEWLKNNKIEDYRGHNIAWDVLGQDIYMQMVGQTSKERMQVQNLVEYEAITNKNNLKQTV